MMAARVFQPYGGWEIGDLRPGRLYRPPGARLAAVGLALLIHLLAALWIAASWPAAHRSAEPRAVNVALVPAPPPAHSDPRPAPRAQAEPAQIRQDALQIADPVADAPPAAEAASSEPGPEGAGRDAPADGSDILTAEGGEAGFAPDAPRAGSGLRGVLCAAGSRHTREAAGCATPREDAFERFTAYADSEAAAHVNRAFALPEGGFTYAAPTADLGGSALPGQLNNEHSHFVRGAHEAFGRLPVPDKARDPGFGD